jgi:hypothetical protein
MKYVVGLLLGLCLGIGAGAALIYFNPLTRDTALSGPAPARAFSYALDGGRLLVSTRDSVPGLPLMPGERPALWERGVRGIVLESFVIDDGDGRAAAVATRLVVPSPDSDGIQAGLLTDDQWLITLPGRGSLIAAGRSNIWPLLRDSVVRVDMLKRDWDGPKTYGMLRGGSAVITGASGDYLGIRGALTETTTLADYPRTGLAGLTGQVDIAFDSND